MAWSVEPMTGTEGGRVRRLACLALAVALVSWAGCLGTDEADGPGPEADDGTSEQGSQPSTIDWGMTGCEVVVAIVPVDAQALAEHLPEGFEPVSAEEAFGLPPDPRGDGALGLETFRCEQGAGLNGTLEDLAYGAVFAPVEAPEDLDHPEADVVFYEWETLVPDEDRRELLTERGLPAVDGNSDLSGLEETPAGHVFDVSVTLDGATFSFTGSAGQANEDFRDGLPFVEFQQGDDGFGYWACLENGAAGANSGSGTVELPAGHWTSDVAASATQQAYMVASTDVTFEQASVVLP